MNFLIKVHTDGSCLGNPGVGGYGAYLQKYKDGELLIEAELKGSNKETTTARRYCSSNQSGPLLQPPACPLSMPRICGGEEDEAQAPVALPSRSGRGPRERGSSSSSEGRVDPTREVTAAVIEFLQYHGYDATLEVSAAAVLGQAIGSEASAATTTATATATRPPP